MRVSHVALSALFMTPRTSGTGTYAREIARALGLARPEATVTAYVAPGIPRPVATPGNVRWVSLPGVRGPYPVRAIAERLLVPRRARRDGAEVIHSLNGNGPTSAALPHVLTVHDLIFEHFPLDYPEPHRSLLSRLARTSARAADRVIADSEATRADLLQTYRLDPDRVVMVPLGPGATDPPVPVDPKACGYILVVSAGHGYKNLDGAVRAVAAMSDPRELVICGGLGPALTMDLAQLAERLGVRLRMPGWVSDQEREGMYAGASVVACPSRAEGFGLPLLEALTRGCPVVASDIAPFREIGGDAVPLVDTTDPVAFARALDAVLASADPGAMVARGCAQIAPFTWERTARQMWRIYDEVAGGGR